MTTVASPAISTRRDCGAFNWAVHAHGRRDESCPTLLRLRRFDFDFADGSICGIISKSAESVNGGQYLVTGHPWSYCSPVMTDKQAAGGLEALELVPRPQ